MNNKTRNIIDVVLIVFVIWSIVFLSGVNFRKTSWVDTPNEQLAQVTTPPNDLPYPPPDHDATISKQWTHTRNDSKNNLPGGWPTEHGLLFTWGHTRTLSTKWPASHEFIPSKAWPPSFHLHSISQTWIGHTQALSATWPPNHLFDISPSWNTDRIHDGTYSQAWPPGHGKVISLDYPEHIPPLRPGHAIALSQNCDPNQPWDGWEGCKKRRLPVHREEDSATWPYNHGPRLSNVWPPGHNNNFSLTWPPGHTRKNSMLQSETRPTGTASYLPVNLNWLLIKDHFFDTSIQNIPSNPVSSYSVFRKGGRTSISSSPASVTGDSSPSSVNSSISAPASLQ